MHPTITTYHLATNPRDYRFCQALLRAAEPDSPPVKLGFPTVYAVRDGALLGFVSTSPDKHQIIAGPLVTDPTIKNTAFITMRLGEAYEQVLKDAGVSSYRLGIHKSRTSWIKIIEKLGFQPYLETNDSLWFERSIANG